MQTTGWLFDLYPLGDRLVLWFITATGARLRVEDNFPYCIYLAGPEGRIRSLARLAGRRGWLRRAYRARGRDLWSGNEVPVLALELASYGVLPRLRKWLGTLPEDISCYNCDLDIASYYLYTRRIWPCAWYGLELEQGRLRRLIPREDPFALEFSPPPLATLGLGLTRDPLIPLGGGNGIALEWEGRTLELEVRDRAELLAELARWLKRTDPDLVLSDWGDEAIIPVLTGWSREAGVNLYLDREIEPVPRQFKGSRSYFSYGRIVYQGAAAPFYGRWHLDRRNSFYFRESGLHGLLQIARVGQMPLQQAARASPGTLITSMQLARATADGFLIPWRKGEPERFKTAAELLTIDKGGLTFMPPVGLHCHVAEVDFASMYPTIMAIHNISPETVNCPCCAEAVASSQLPVASKAGVRGQGSGVSNAAPPPPAVPMPARAPARHNHINVEAEPVGAQLAVPCGREATGRTFAEQPSPAVLASPATPGATVGATRRVAPTCPHPDPVPEAGYHLCQRREGLVPRTLRPILRLRERLKARAKEAPPEEAKPYKERQTALKWMLVTCFGYLGYKNARFGRIEAHEAVTAYGRDKLLRAKEIFEAEGFEILHGLTDCLWVQKPPVNACSLSSQENLVGAHPCVRPHRGGHAGPPPQKLQVRIGGDEGNVSRLSHPSPQPSPLAGEREFWAAACFRRRQPRLNIHEPIFASPPRMKIPPAPLLLKEGIISGSRWKTTNSVGADPRVRPKPGPTPGSAPTIVSFRFYENGIESLPWAKGDLGGFKKGGFLLNPAAPQNDFLGHFAVKWWHRRLAGLAQAKACGYQNLPLEGELVLAATRYEKELEDLCAQVSAATGVKLALEGVYRWICFMPSKQDPKRPVATRYFGVFRDGSLKVRGLACRRRDTPPFVRRAQEALLARMAQAANPAELAALRPELEEMAAGFRQRLREGGVPPQDLVITRVLSQKVEEYKVDTPTALAARQLEAAGIVIQPGEKVRYVHREPKGGPKECRIQAAPFLETLDDYDAGHYLELLERALEEVMLVFAET